MRCYKAPAEVAMGMLESTSLQVSASGTEFGTVFPFVSFGHLVSGDLFRLVAPSTG